MGTRGAVWCMAALLAFSEAAQADVTGRATVIDGDTIVVAGERIRLHGIEAPELSQTCTAFGHAWQCGRTWAEWLRERLNGRQVQCVGHARDRYQRLLAVCYVGGGSINERIVRDGWASTTASTPPTTCKPRPTPSAPAPGRGEFTPPWEWRKQDRRH